VVLVGWVGEEGRRRTNPFEGHFASGLDGHGGAVALALLVAHDIDLAEAIGAHEAVVEVVGLPSDSGGDGRLVLESSIPALVLFAISDDFVDVAVGSDERWESDGSNEGLHDWKKRVREWDWSVAALLAACSDILSS
jgi:hypothetical protein